MMDSESYIPYIQQGIGHCLECKDRVDTDCRPDYRKKNVYKLKNGDVEFDFMDYAPHVFKSIRKLYGLSQEAYATSIVGAGINGGKLGQGKSGMLFFFSNDRRFLLKTITRAELKFFRKIIRNYHSHVIKHPHTLLSRFFGMCKLTIGSGKPFRLIVMNNLFNTQFKLHEKYDLKGSTRNRWVDTDTEGSKGVLKDLNYTSSMYMGQMQKEAVLMQMQIDTGFLMRNNIMDQSLLLGVSNSHPYAVDPALDLGQSFQVEDLFGPLHAVKPGQADLFNCFQLVDGGTLARDPVDLPMPHVYFFGIIDILQEFNFEKKIESTYKGIRYNKKAISAVNSKLYGKRFLQYMQEQMV